MTLQRLAVTVTLLLVIGAQSAVRLNAISAGTPIPAVELAPDGDFEWLVRLEADDQTCSGSLVAAEWVLTNAHCGDARFAFVGDDTIGTEIVEVAIHPQFEEGQIEFDVALLRLAVPSSVRPVRRASSTLSIAVGQELTLAGWGRSAPLGASATQPSSAAAIVEVLDSTLIQTGAPAVGCSGDSGGPLLFEGNLVGIIVAGDAGCNVFTISVRLSNIAAWVASVAGSGSSDPPPNVRNFELTVTAGQPFEIELELPNPSDELIDVSTEGLLVASCTEALPLICQFFAPFGGNRDLLLAYSVSDGQRTIHTRWTIHVLADAGPPAAPVAQDEHLFALPGVPRAVALSASDENGDSLIFEIVTPPSHGVLSDCATGTCAYTAPAGYAGPDRFTWRASDGQLASNVATMSIDIQPAQAPIVTAGTFYAVEDNPEWVGLAAVDPNGDAIQYQIVTAPRHGRLTNCSRNVCLYQAQRGFLGTDSFTWRATDGVLSSAPVTLTIEVVSHYPPIAQDARFSIKANNVQRFKLPGDDPENQQLTLTLVTMPTHGTVTCEALTCQYRPQLDYFGPDSFTWRVSDGELPSRVATATLNIHPSSWRVQPLDVAGSAHALAAAIAGPGSVVRNAQLTGAPAAAGAFTGAAGAIGLENGVILSTGRVADAVGPNLAEFMSTEHDLPGDAELPAPSADAVALSFDLVPSASTFTVRYVFASEEYPHAIGFVDEAAAIMVNGRNCAVVADQPVGTNSINHGNDDLGVPAANPSLLIANDTFGAVDTEMNAITVVLTCTAAVVPGVPNRVKIVIADNFDGERDSVLFVEGTTAPNTPPAIAPLADITRLAADSNGAVVTFTASGNDAEDGSLAAECLPASGATFPIGDTIVTCTVTDRDGATAPGSFTVTVTEPATPGHMSGDGFVRDGETRYQFTFDARENDRGERAAFSLRINTEAPKGKGKDKEKAREDQFESRTVTFISFSDDPDVRHRPRRPQVDAVLFSGMGEWNGKAGYRYEVAAQDEAEAGRRHRESIRVTVWNAAGQVVAGFSGEIGGGAVRSKRLKH